MTTSKFQRFTQWCIHDRDGNIVLGQSPNLPIIVAPVAAVLAIILPGILRDVLGLVAFGAFFTWAWLEIFDGTTPLRRITGGFAMIALFVAAIIVIKGDIL